ncbi:hypothetical protein HID58_014056 [Brassica napus]|uniref:Uncharacterized protein n=1 Tax=Brassica napus TaxID=3708 RepID=A0ABQ8DG20_BRANA|nr:hypothetical protein HID58_014056 [Brassica napus]
MKPNGDVSAQRDRDVEDDDPLVLAKQSITSQSQVDSLLLLLTGDVQRDRACCMYPSDHQMRRVSGVSTPAGERPKSEEGRERTCDRVGKDLEQHVRRNKDLARWIVSNNLERENTWEDVTCRFLKLSIYAKRE